MKVRIHIFLWAAVIVWLLFLFLVGVAVGHELRPDVRPRACPNESPRVENAFSFSPFDIPRGACNVR
ncbi:hypothetical protein FF36_06408 [Frankia torreyi]|uniref:Uncharacterized protein n=1 Tax=Frankia torreyi TaxID=1856 RepID=A0A0D8B5Y0_9ACTN|nr:MULTISPECIES: hypothetical protein [Frankia]KJE19319.1 hypothetical protein FF36_06408 [Frankia torreyi]KQM01737.1 hypothetical protein FF86_11174 [Frankia sp. CpI1-P]